MRLSLPNDNFPYGLQQKFCIYTVCFASGVQGIFFSQLSLRMLLVTQIIQNQING
jgi:hypothetical protein